MATPVGRRQVLFAGAIGLGAGWAGAASAGSSLLAPEPTFPLRSRGLSPERAPQDRLRLGSVGPGRVFMVNIHTGEEIDVAYRVRGAYASRAMFRLDNFLRDWRTGAVVGMDPLAVDAVAAIREATGRRGPIHVLSGYRTAATNAMLARQGRDVAQASLHVTGQAIDIAMPGYPLNRLRDHAIALGLGGVGYYPDSGFIHVDTGRVRTWG
jgi:uncharacterized protein YcbK (DUF882 family)